MCERELVVAVREKVRHFVNRECMPVLNNSGTDSLASRVPTSTSASG